ncbi:MAG TPA: Flp pilus assembly protein CpaB [Victivallales bacterium]|nr:Flp pilus assembly protein CpaB [Victivallales bacterium]HRU01002.1 Flp pilus assembly protein CpaB [Victivallales bacterium]
MKQKLMIILAVFFGFLAFILTYLQIKYEREKVLGAAKDVILLRLKRSIPQGEKITESDIEAVATKRFPTVGQVEIEARDKHSVIGRRLTVSVLRGEFLKWFQLEDDTSVKQQGLAAIIPKGLRAISIPVDTTSSVTGLIKPGHHIDIIGTFNFPEMKGDKSLDTITLTILQNVVVLATGTQFAAAERTSGRTASQKGYNTVTLSLTPREVEMIVFASQKGKLTLSLRNFEDAVFEYNLQSVNFKYLEQHIDEYTQKREKFMKLYNVR